MKLPYFIAYTLHPHPSILSFSRRSESRTSLVTGMSLYLLGHHLAAKNVRPCIKMETPSLSQSNGSS